MSRHTAANGEDQELPERENGTESREPLAMCAQKRWRRLRGSAQFADLVAEVKSTDGNDGRESSRKAA